MPRAVVQGTWNRAEHQCAKHVATSPVRLLLLRIFLQMKRPRCSGHSIRVAWRRCHCARCLGDLSFPFQRRMVGDTMYNLDEVIVAKVKSGSPYVHEVALFITVQT
jgi:hypothetical protein